MNLKEAQEKAASWLQKMQEHYEIKDLEPCDFFIEELSVLDLIVLADDVEFLGKYLEHWGAKSIDPCICDAISVHPDLQNSNIFKTLAAVGVDFEKCLKMKKADIDVMIAEMYKNDEDIIDTEIVADDSSLEVHSQGC